MHFQRPDSRNDDDCRGREPCHTALDVEEFLRTEVCAEARLGYRIVTHLERKLGRYDRIAAVGDICKRPAVNECGRSLESLNEVRLYRILKQRRHCTRRLKVARGYWLIVVGIADYYRGEPLFQVRNRACKAKNCHNLACNGDIKAVLAGRAVRLPAKSVNDEAELAVVHINASLPGYLANVDAERIALLDMVIEHCGEKIVCRADSVEIAREMKVDVLHRNDLGVAAPRSTAFNAEHGAKRGLAERNGDVLSYSLKSVCKSYRRSRLSLARGGGGYRRDENELAVLTVGL